MSRGFDSTLAAWASPRDALLHQNLSGAVSLKAGVGKLRGKGFTGLPAEQWHTFALAYRRIP